MQDRDYGLSYMVAFERNEGGFNTEKSHSKAVYYYNELQFMGYDDWRLSTIDEAGNIFGSSGISNYFPYDVTDVWIWTKDSLNDHYYAIYKIQTDGLAQTGNSWYGNMRRYLCIRDYDPEN